MVTTSQIGQSPFEPITDFRAFATDPTATVKLKEPAMFDLVAAINQTRKTYEALVSIRATIVVGGDQEPMLAEALDRFKEQATALGYVVEPADEVSTAKPEPMPFDVVVGSDYRYVGGGSHYYTTGKLYRVRGGDPADMFVVDDNQFFGDAAHHHWNIATFQARFEPVNDDAAMAAVEGGRVAAE